MQENFKINKRNILGITGSILIIIAMIFVLSYDSTGISTLEKFLSMLLYIFIFIIFLVSAFIALSIASKSLGHPLICLFSILIAGLSIVSIVFLLTYLLLPLI